MVRDPRVTEPEGEKNESGAIDAATSRFPMIVHELRGPMTAIQSAAELLELRLSKFDPIPPGIAPVLERLRRNVGLLDRMTTDLLALSRSQLGPEALEKRPADLGAIVAQILTDGHWGDRARLATAPPTVPLVCDADRVGQIVLNLVRNAVDHGGGGPVDVGIVACPGGFILTVDNDGDLPAAVRAHLFQPFVRGRPAGKGLGLGLYLVRRFVEAHGGTISAESDGQRVRFSVFLPAS